MPRRDTALTMPSTSSSSAVFAPSTLPLTTSVVPCAAATTEATSSGSEVPMATMKMPTANGDKPSASPVRSAAPVNHLAPPTRAAIATASSRDASRVESWVTSIMGALARSRAGGLCPG